MKKFFGTKLGWVIWFVVILCGAWCANENAKDGAAEGYRRAMERPK